jgi:hypothetical protein
MQDSIMHLLVSTSFWSEEKGYIARGCSMEDIPLTAST